MRPKPFRDARPVRKRGIATLALVGALAGACSSQQSSGTATTSAEPVTARASDTARAIDTAGAQGTTGAAAADGPTRMERDLLGEKAVPANAYYGVQTARALENFRISGVTISHYPGFVEAWAIVKQAAARANTDVGAMNKETLAAIEKATAAVIRGEYRDQFVVDWYQGGAGTSTNMNANEVLANIALELGGHKKGDYKIVEPHDHLNLSQSTNDSYPTALKVAFILRNDVLITELQALVASFRAKGNQYIDTVKMGRTEMQDAVPMTVGQEFHSFAAALESEIKLLREAERHLYAVNMGATAIGTGLNAPKGYAEKVAAHLATITGKPIVLAPDMIAATWDQQGFVVVFVRAQERGDQDVEDCQRSDPAGVRPARRTGRDQSPRSPARLVDHAGQGEPGHSGAGEPRGVPGDGQRLHRHAGGQPRSAAVERLRAARRARDHGVAAPDVHDLPGVP